MTNIAKLRENQAKNFFFVFHITQIARALQGRRCRGAGRALALK